MTRMQHEGETKPNARVLNIMRRPLRTDIGSGLVRLAIVETLGVQVEALVRPLNHHFSWGRTYLLHGKVAVIELASNETGLFHLVFAHGLEPDNVLRNAPNVEITFAEAPWEFARHLTD